MDIAALSSSALETLATDTAEAASAARLRYVSDTKPGIRRIGAGRGFTYRDINGSPVRDPQMLQRIRSLAIPPAWTEVWICPTSTGHIQAVGRDARGRKQYRYHPRWREVRDETKYARLLDFGRVLPRIRRQLSRDMKRTGLPRDKVLATLVHLLETTLIRVGNEEYARHNNSYGLTTLRSRHVQVRGPRLRFEFRGKGGQPHAVDVNDRRVAAIVRRCQDLPGHELFQYVDDAGIHRSIDSADVNEYIRRIAGREFTAKDFRTWAASVLALGTLRAQSAARRATKRIVNACVAKVAERLRNTPAICRKCYIHPAILDAYRESRLGGPMAFAEGPGDSALRRDERAVLRLLSRRPRSERARSA